MLQSCTVVWSASVWTFIAIYCVSIAAATIGLTQTEITVIEGRTAEVCVSVTNGTLGREVIVQLTTDNGTATGINLLHACSTYLLILYLCSSFFLCLFDCFFVCA